MIEIISQISKTCHWYWVNKFVLRLSFFSICL